MQTNNIAAVASRFELGGEVQSVERFGSGHINDTFAIATPRRRYVLQRLNTSIFADPEALMDNLLMVTDHLREKIAEEGGDPLRETLTPIPARDGKWFVRTADSSFWRMTVLVEHSFSMDRATRPEDMREGGRGFGTFMRRLSDFPIHKLHNTIPNFHNTSIRLAHLKMASDVGDPQRAKSAVPELDAYLSRIYEYVGYYEEIVRKLPLRVTHNDTKINNILFDCSSRKALAVIDLDTVMPGYSAFDFGDSIRTCAATADEDTQNPETMGVSVELFSAYARGYFEGAGSISPDEQAALVLGAKLMTYECGARFLTDWLGGDTYFKVSRPDHNLDRARAQMALLEDMERRSDELEEAIRTAAEAAR